MNPLFIPVLVGTARRECRSLLVAPEYKNGIPGSLKNALDFLLPGALRLKPIGICSVSAGGFGGINCLAQLRLVSLALGGLPIPDFVAVSHVSDSFGGPRNLRPRERALTI